MLQTQSFQEPLTATPGEKESEPAAFYLPYGNSRPGHSPRSPEYALHNRGSLKRALKPLMRSTLIQQGEHSN